MLSAHVLVVASSTLLYQLERPATTIAIAAAALLRCRGASAPRRVASIVLAPAPLLRRPFAVGHRGPPPRAGPRLKRAVAERGGGARAHVRGERANVAEASLGAVRAAELDHRLRRPPPLPRTRTLAEAASTSAAAAPASASASAAPASASGPGFGFDFGFGFCAIAAIAPIAAAAAASATAIGIGHHRR